MCLAILVPLTSAASAQRAGIFSASAIPGDSRRLIDSYILNYQEVEP
jgi:hypothetical protein